ncbi:hypothetical protein FRC08_006653 [Ceratobasidium sp. 394]|nr:hypothetical protein FRC08_006653 [Ceratobasidium sp. 394]
MSSNPPLRKKLRKYFAQSGDKTIPTFQLPTSTCPPDSSASQSQITSTGGVYTTLPASDAKNYQQLSSSAAQTSTLPLPQFRDALLVPTTGQSPAYPPAPEAIQASHTLSSSRTLDPPTAPISQALQTSRPYLAPRATLPAAESAGLSSRPMLDDTKELRAPPTVSSIGAPGGLPNAQVSIRNPSSSAKSPPGASNASLRLKNSLKTLGRIASVVPNFKTTLDILADGIDLIPETVQRRREYEQLASEASMAAIGLEKHLNQMSPGQMSECVESVASELKAHAEYATKKNERRSLRPYLESEQDTDDVIACYRRIEALFRQLQANAILSVWKTTNESTTVMNEHIAETRLKGLNPVVQARYDSAISGDLRECSG